MKLWLHSWSPCSSVQKGTPTASTGLRLLLCLTVSLEFCPLPGQYSLICCAHPRLPDCSVEECLGLHGLPPLMSLRRLALGTINSGAGTPNHSARMSLFLPHWLLRAKMQTDGLQTPRNAALGEEKGLFCLQINQAYQTGA